MHVKRPSLIVLAVILLGVLCYLLNPWSAGSTVTGGPAGGGGTAAEAAATGRQPGAGESAAGTDRQGGAKEERAAVQTGPRFALRGQVVGQDGVPVAGAEVVAYRGSPNDRRMNLFGMITAQEQAAASGAATPGRLAEETGEPLARATVDADGGFVFEGLPTPHLRLTVEHDFYAMAQSRSVHLDDQGDGFVLLRPYLGGHLVGQIRGDPKRGGAGDRDPDPGRVKLIAEIDPLFFMRNPQDFMGQVMNSIGREAPVDGDGRFEFRAVLPASSISLAYRSDRDVALREGLAIAAGQKTEVVLQVLACGAVAVRVTCRGEPVAEARVRLVSSRSRGQTAEYVARGGRTDAQGIGRVEQLLPGPYHVDVDCEGFVGDRREGVVRAGETSEIAVELERGATVRGTVVDPDGAPVADAGVRYIPAMNLPILGDLAEATGEDIVVQRARHARLRTDAKGRFEIRGIPGEEKFGIAAWHEDFAGGFVRDVAPGQEGVVIGLQRATTLIGKVVDDATGEPVPDFTAETLVRMMMVIERPSKSVAITGSGDGRFRLARVPPGKAVLRVQALGYAELRQSIELESGSEVDAGECRLVRGATVRGVVRLGDGEPAPGVMVAPKAVGMLDNPLLQSMFGSRSATTDRAGRFELGGLGGGAVVLKASSPIHASGVSQRIPLQPGETVDGVEIVLAAGGAIEGRLLLPEGMSGEGWLVTVSSQQGGSMRSEMLDRDGRFGFTGIDPGRYEVQAMRLEWMQNMQSEKMGMFKPGRGLDMNKLMEAAMRQMVRARCRVKDGETTRVELDGGDLLADGVSVTVRVTLGERPMATGWLEVERIADGRITQGVIDKGTARLAAVQPGQYRLAVRTGMTMTPVGEATTVTIPAGRTHQVAVRLAGGSIEGRVVDEATGEPLQHAVVRIVSGKGVQSDQVEEIGFAVTDGDGRFGFDGLDDGSYSLFANDSFFAQGDKSHGGRLDDVRIALGGAVERVVLRARRAARVSVRVSDPGDLAVGRAMLLPLDPTGRPMGSLPTFSDASGRATLLGLPPGQLRVVALGSDLVPGYSEVVEVLEGRETEVLVTMGRGPRVRVRVEDAAGRPVQGVRLSARWRGGPWIPISLLQRADPQTGGLDLGHLPPLEVEFRVHLPAGRSFVERRTLPSGSSAELVFTAPK